MNSDSMTQQAGKGIAATADFVFELVEGKKYKWGGKNLDGFDRSGYVAHVFKRLFPEKSALFNTSVAGFIDCELFAPVSTPQAGEIIIFPKHLNYVNHIGIVVDRHGWIGSQSSTGVAFVMFNNKFWSSRPYYFKRYKFSSPKSISACFSSVGRLHA